jgi:hypothetical protein
MSSPATQGLITKAQLPSVAMEQGKKRGRTRNCYIKNSSPVPNWYFDDFLPDSDIPAYVHLVFLFLLRRTIGWDKLSESVSYEDIEFGTGASRDSVRHAVLLLCDCWGLFTVEPGRGRRKSNFTVSGTWGRDEVQDRKNALYLYGPYKSDCPTLEQLRAKPCTVEVIQNCFRMQNAERAEIERRSSPPGRELTGVAVH